MFFMFEAPFAVPSPIAVDPLVGQIAVQAEKAHPSPPLPPPTPEQLQAVDQCFTSSRDSHLAAGLIGMWASTGMLHDLMVQHLGKRAGEFEEEEKEERGREQDKLPE